MEDYLYKKKEKTPFFLFKLGLTLRPTTSIGAGKMHFSKVFFKVPFQGKQSKIRD